MRLIWKVLRRHMSAGQLAGFVIANIIGLTIIVLGLQLYMDIRPLMTGKGGFMAPDDLVLSKRVSAVDALSGSKPAFTEEEIGLIASQPFVAEIGRFTAAQYRIWGRLSIPSYDVDIATDLFFESVPDQFIDVESEEWEFSPSSSLIPIILPRTYLNLYNFGYAPTSDFPAVSEGMIRKLTLDITLWGNGDSRTLKGRVVGFSSRLNTILVPQSFIDWSNARFASGSRSGSCSRLIIRVTNPSDERIAAFCEAHELSVEGDHLNASRAAWLMRILVAVVLLIGLVICLLAGYILILSIFLLLQRNQEEIRNLKAIGYAPRTLALPYQLVVLFTNLLSFAASMGLLMLARTLYTPFLHELAPDIRMSSTSWAWIVAGSFALLMTIIHTLIIRRKL